MKDFKRTYLCIIDYFDERKKFNSYKIKNPCLTYSFHH